MAARRFDPVTLEILWTRLISMVDEASATFVRTSFSTLVREANDFAVVLTDAEGRSLAQSSLSIPSFIGTLPRTVGHFLARYPATSLRPGDVLITNNPWLGTGHLMDINTAMPIFHKGRLIAFAAAVSHVPDIGGRLRSAGIRELFEEGLHIPVMKLMEAGRPNAALVTFIEENVRVPEQTMGDVWAQVTACRMLERRLGAFLAETRVDLGLLAREVQGRSEAAMRAAIRALPDGEYRSRVENDGFEGVPIVINCCLTVKGDRIHIDYTGSSPQLPRSVNVVPSYTHAYSCFPIKAALCPDIPNNEGSFRPVTTWAPEGTILNPRWPAASGARNVPGHLLPPAVLDALAACVPERVIAQGSPNSSFTMAGSHRGRRYAVVNFLNGGQGGSQTRDGHSVLSFPSNLGNTPLEVMESLAPIRVIERRRRQGSGGTGRHRGGEGCRIVWRMEGEEPAQVSFIMSRARAPAHGLLGGGDGLPGGVTVNGVAIDHSQHQVVRKGDLVVMDTAGGGGFGEG